MYKGRRKKKVGTHDLARWGLDGMDCLRMPYEASLASRWHHERGVTERGTVDMLGVKHRDLGIGAGAVRYGERWKRGGGRVIPRLAGGHHSATIHPRSSTLTLLSVASGWTSSPSFSLRRPGSEPVLPPKRSLPCNLKFQLAQMNCF